MKKRYLVMEDGSVFEGYAFGADADAAGELVFQTGVCGYIETLTDPCCDGQIVVQTFPLVGNYGIIEEDFEGPCRLRGYVVREWCRQPSNFRCQYDLDTYLKQAGVPGIWGVDTRQITKTIRERGTMKALLCDSVPADLSPVWAAVEPGSVAAVAGTEVRCLPADGEERFRVALLDCGALHDMAAQLRKRGCTVTVCPADTSAETLLAGGYDGLLVSDGPGDPGANPTVVALLKQLLGRLPMFGIGLGHQLMALAAGARTEKLKYGHRGGNQPVRDMAGTRTYITGQNHSYVVVSDSVTAGTVRYVNVNDQTCEGVDYPSRNAFSVQFRPETSVGPNDTAYLYDRFAELMGGEPVCR